MPRQDQRYVTDLCEEVLGLAASREHTFDWLRGDLSEKTGRRAKLPVDAYWESLGLVMEFQESQHFEPIAHFDHMDRATVSGVPRGGPDGQRARYDRHKVELVPQHGLRLVVIHKSNFTVKRYHIVPERAADLATVRRHLVDFL